jgi:acyl-CoA synthetase (AMP-forming)/AMP-acid ligase II
MPLFGGEPKLDVAGTRTLPSVVLARAASEPNRTFLEVFDQGQGVLCRVTFGELRTQMLVAAHWLRVSCGLTHGESVAFLAHNSVGYISLSFGAMALGATSINLNWRNAIKVNETLLNDLKPRVLLFSSPFKDDARALHAALDTKIVHIESICDAEPSRLPFTAQPEQQEELANIADGIKSVDPGVVAAVFFTGGTTGTPKAVPHSHAGLLWFSDQMLAASPAPFAERVEHRGTVGFTPCELLAERPEPSPYSPGHVCPLLADSLHSFPSRRARASALCMQTFT